MTTLRIDRKRLDAAGLLMQRGFGGWSGSIQQSELELLEEIGRKVTLDWKDGWPTVDLYYCDRAEDRAFVAVSRPYHPGALEHIRRVVDRQRNVYRYRADPRLRSDLARDLRDILQTYDNPITEYPAASLLYDFNGRVIVGRFPQNLWRVETRDAGILNYSPNNSKSSQTKVSRSFLF